MKQTQLSSEDQIMDCEFAVAEAGQIQSGAGAGQSKYVLRTQETLVQLFRFLQAKEIFIQTYLEYLSERLLNDQSKGGAEREMEVASLFKTECGDQFRKQTEQMITDYQQRRELSDKFWAQSKRVKAGQSFSFLVLDSTKWPIKNTECLTVMPREIKDVYEEFT